MKHAVPIVGIAGLPRSGKDTVAKVFIDAGFFPVSLGEIIRQLSRQRHADKADPISVAHMTETANYHRSQYGADFALKEALEVYNRDAPEGVAGLLIVSVRAPVEADFIVQEKHGRLIWVEANDNIRYARAVEFSRDGEMANIDMDTFLAHEALQWQPKPGIAEEAQMNVAYVKHHATDIIENNENNLKKLYQKTKQLLEIV